MTPQNSSNKFLQLPTELRLMIYFYALTSTQPVLGTVISISTGEGTIYIPKLYTQEKHSLAKQANNPEVSKEEFNQLRHVCRQTCQETRGLSLRHNNVVIKYDGSTTAVELCTRFLNSIAPTHHRHIQHLELIEAAGGKNAWSSSDTSPARWHAVSQLLKGRKHPAIHAFCRANQKTGAKVLLRFELRSLALGGKDRLEKAGLDLLTFHAALRMVLRGSSVVEKGVYNDLLRSLVLADKAGIEHAMGLGGSHDDDDDDDGDGDTENGSAGARSAALLDNLRVTVGTAWVGPTAELVSIMESRAMLRVPVKTWFQIAKQEFEEGC